MSANGFAHELSQEFETQLPLDRFVYGKKRIEYTQEDGDLRRFCRKKGFKDYQSFRAHEVRGLFYVTCVKNPADVGSRLLEFKTDQSSLAPLAEYKPEVEHEITVVDSKSEVFMRRLGIWDDFDCFFFVDDKAAHLFEMRQVLVRNKKSSYLFLVSSPSPG